MPSPELLGAMTEFRNQMSRSIVAYFKVWDFLTLRMEAMLGATIHEIPDEREFWLRLAQAVYGVDARRSVRGAGTLHRARHNAEFDPDQPKGFKHGDQVTLRNFYISDWIPRIPGELWKQEIVGGEFGGDFGRFEDFFDPDSHGKSKRAHTVPREAKNWIMAASQRHSDGLAMAAGIPSYDWFGKTRITLAGVGSIRLPLNFADSDHFACLGAVTAGSWITDLGIPVVVSEQVYREFDRSRCDRNVAVEADLRGRLVIGHIPDPFVHITSIESESQVRQAESILRRSTGIPLAYIHVTTPLDCDFRKNSTHPECNAWTLFKCVRDPEDETVNLDTRKMVSGLGAYGLTFTSFQPDRTGDVDRAVQFLSNSPKWLRIIRLGRTKLADRDEEFNVIAEEWQNTKVQLLTDFDGLVPRLTNAEFAFQSAPKLHSRSMESLTGIENDFKRFREQIASKASIVAFDRKEFLHSRAYGKVTHPNLILEDPRPRLICCSCESELPIEPAPEYGKTDWSERIDSVIRENGWSLSPGRCFCHGCVLRNPELREMIDADNQTCADLLVIASELTSYRGFPVDLPNLLHCSKCDSRLGISDRENENAWYLPYWAWIAGQAMIRAQWRCKDGTFLCRDCKT